MTCWINTSILHELLKRGDLMNTRKEIQKGPPPDPAEKLKRISKLQHKIEELQRELDRLQKE
ncbi:hypothetical protein SAMN03080599_03350 [Acidaminobacter hydrogenoformans DSM 2784]|uniref:Uncharacterized protein n=1 Tax=Acidaminobacter hydrogenoformans DSM 2784 TaxID=1120920 RepID=A0A1G5S705_9FIRM|nr:hypothetical protein SAMN03080599_03350 [Acidaminobacter hydrogenoformans DSM 2784]